MREKEAKEALVKDDDDDERKKDESREEDARRILCFSRVSVYLIASKPRFIDRKSGDLTNENLHFLSQL